ncbi:hypothetical protein EYF80_014503 [Liparis tanakae]|uniref:Uncharacterized protein n=1 Tax=Liparis tanakae TaxID=230148 RepID=A0A4Z2IBA3_9TELE|nr:hypothetical protein EYF80_014503 [Liparis tanakae]
MLGGYVSATLTRNCNTSWLLQHVSIPSSTKGQGQKGMSGGSEGSEAVLAITGVRADDAVWRVKALLCGWGVGSLRVSCRPPPILLLRGMKYLLRQTQRDPSLCEVQVRRRIRSVKSLASKPPTFSSPAAISLTVDLLPAAPCFTTATQCCVSKYHRMLIHRNPHRDIRGIPSNLSETLDIVFSQMHAGKSAETHHTNTIMKHVAEE